MDKSTHSIPRINLARKRAVFVDTFLHWALTTGRFIIIITETVALAAFAMRFSLDNQIINLHDKIKGEQAIVSLLQHQENSYRNLQDRLATIHTVDTQAQTQTSNFFSLLESIPGNVQVNSFDFSQDKLHLDVTVKSTTILDQFMQALKSQQSVSGISVDKVQNNISEGTIDVALTASLHQT